jgi:hypothetical protein
VGGEEYLAVSQGVGAVGDRLQPQSAILQWDGQRFGPMLSAPPWGVRAGALKTHSYSMRVPAGSAVGWKFLDLPSTSSSAPSGGRIRVLAGMSQTAGLAGFSFDFPTAEGLKGLSSAAVGPADAVTGSRLIYTVSDADAALGIVSRSRIEDSLGGYVASLSAQNTWKEGGAEGLNGVRGARSIKIADPSTSGGDGATTVLEIRSGGRNSELVCGPAPMHSPHSSLEEGGGGRGMELHEWQRSIYFSDCQTVSFRPDWAAGASSLFSVDPVLSSEGTLEFELVEEGSGVAILGVRANDDGADTAPETPSMIYLDPSSSGGIVSTPRWMSVNVAPLNKAPSFTLLSENGVVFTHEDAGEVSVLFADGLSSGPEGEAPQGLSWNLTSYTNKKLFSTPLRMVVSQGRGYILANPARDEFGDSEVTCELIDAGGTLFVALDKSSGSPRMSQQGSDRTELVRFTLRVSSRNDAPSFQIPAGVKIQADSGPLTYPGFATGMNIGPANENGQTWEFVLARVLNAGSFWGADSFFKVPPAITPGGTLSFTVGDRVSGNVAVTMTMRDSGTSGPGEQNSFNQTFLVEVFASNFEPIYYGPDPAVIVVPQSLAAEEQHAVTFATGVSSGSLDEDLSQSVTFDVTVIDPGPLVFMQAPEINSQGILTFSLAPTGPGDAIVSIILRDDGGTADGGVDRTQPERYNISVVHVNLPPSFSLSSRQVVAVEGGGLMSVRGFASDISKGDETEIDQIIWFNLTYSSSTPGLFTTAPTVDEEGTLTLSASPDKHGTAYATLKLTDSGGSEQGGNDTPPEGPTTFEIRVLPKPRIKSVFPVVGPASGNSRVTITGLFFRPRSAPASPSAAASCVHADLASGSNNNSNSNGTCASLLIGSAVAFVGGVPCTQTTVVSDEEAVCTLPAGSGMHKVSLTVTESADAVRIGEMDAALFQGGVYYGGDLSASGDGYLGVHTDGLEPRADYVSGGGVVDGSVRSIAVLRGDVYIGGSFRQTVGPAGVEAKSSIAQYVAKIAGGSSGQHAVPLASGVDGAVNALAVYRDALVVGGAFARVAGMSSGGGRQGRGLAVWDGTQWSLLPGGDFKGVVNALHVSDGVLYVAGGFTDEVRINNIAMFDGERWSSLCSPSGGACGVSGGAVHALAMIGTDLFVAGSFASAGGIAAKSIAKWDGSRWMEYGSFDAPVHALGVFGDQLIAGGQFTAENEAGALNAIAARRSGGWASLGGGVDGGPVYAVASDGRCVYACGSFEVAGAGNAVSASASRYAARWCEDPSNTRSVSWEGIAWGQGAERTGGTCRALLEAP